MLFKSLIPYAAIAAAINSQNLSKSVEAVKLLKSLVEKPEKHIVSCIGAMDHQYGWTQNPFWDRVESGMRTMQQYFVDKHNVENAIFMAPVAQGFCVKWLKTATEHGFDATVIVPSNNYVGKPFKEDGIFGTKAMFELFGKIGSILVTEDKPENNLKPVKMAQLLLIALSDEMVVFENSKAPKQWVEVAVEIATATGVKVVKKDVSPFLNLTPIIEIPESPIVKLDIKKGFNPVVPPVSVIAPAPGIIPAAELIKSFVEEVEEPQSPIVSVTKGGVTTELVEVEPPKKKRGRPRKNAVNMSQEKELQEQFMALPG